MNRIQWITLGLAVFNLLMVYLFPPFDYVSQARAGVATFDGFAWAFDDRPNYVVNKSFLQLKFFRGVVECRDRLAASARRSGESSH